MRNLSIKDIVAAAKQPNLHNRISPPGSRDICAIARDIGPLPEEYIRFLDENGAWNLFRTIGNFNSEYWWFGVGCEPKISRTDNDVWFACGYRFTLGYYYFKYDPDSCQFSPAVYGARGSGLGIYAEDFNEWFQQSIVWAHRQLPKKVWKQEFGLSPIRPRSKPNR